MTLKQVREALGLSQSELDRRAGVGRGTTQELESGRNSNPTVSVCSQIVEALRRAGAKGVDIEQLFVARKGAA